MMLKCSVLLFLIFGSAGFVYSRPATNSEFDEITRKCGYESCPVPDPNKLNIHIVAHTHDDVGWLKTVDQYYYGSKTMIQKAGVQYIIDSVVQELLKDPAKRFIYVESAFFFKWWKEQTPELQEKVKQLVNEGRLEFIGGAWSMNDEATTHYQSIIDQFAWGLRLLDNTFGECGRPRIGWQIDPFGHSREMASIFAQMGYDGLFFGRLDYEDKRKRLLTKTAEMIWNASPNLGESSDLFTGALYNQYQPPPGFCFDILCADEPIIDARHSPDNNVNRRVNEFFDYVKNMSAGYQTNNVLVTMGEDFQYQDANMWYKNLDKLIKYANERQLNGSDVNLFYSTPSCYLKALHDSGSTWPTKQDDFFPYASDPHAFWTGYYTSRPTLKRYERVGNHFLQICKQLGSLAPFKEGFFDPHLSFLRETMGVMQHHDAVTGTEKQHVADDYARRLDIGIRACAANTRAIMNSLTTGLPNKQAHDHETKIEYTFEFKSCFHLNMSECDISEEKSRFVVTLYNPLAHSTFEHIRVPISGSNYQVKDYRGVLTPSQVVPVPISIRNVQFRSSNSTNELVFLASELPPLGFKSFYIQKQPADEELPSDNENQIDSEPDVVLLEEQEVPSSNIIIGNKYINLTFNNNGLLSSVASNGVELDVSQNFYYYRGASGNNMEFLNRSSGAYIFRPNGSEVLIANKAEIQVIRGPLVEEVHQIFNEWVSQVVRVYKDENYAEFEWLVGPIPVDDLAGKEIITRFSSDIKSDGIFYTDSNGREMIKRKRGHRDTWEINLQEKVAGNYYPITTKIALEDENARMAILVDRAQGGSSLADGSLEIMVHRRLLHDDAFGVEEALNETAFGKGLVSRGTHYLVVGPSKSNTPTTQAQERFLQVRKLLPNWLFFSDASKYPYDEWTKNYTNIFSGLTLSLPQNLHLMTMEPWHEDELLVRFEHILEKDEDPEYSKPVTFNLKDVLRDLHIVSIQEKTLDGNMLLTKSKRLKFQPDPEGTKYETIPREAYDAFKRTNVPPSKRSLDVHMASLPKITLSVGEDVFRNFNVRNRRGLQIVEHEDQSYLKARSIIDNPEPDIYRITVNPMQIRTFSIILEKKI